MLLFVHNYYSYYNFYLFRPSNTRFRGCGDRSADSIKAEEEFLADVGAGSPHLPPFHGGPENCALGDQQHTKDGIHRSLFSP